MKFYKCQTCTNIFEVIQDSNITPVCCGKNMDVLKPNAVDTIAEKHVPSYKIENNTLFVQIGELIHPMEIEHYIQWIEVVTNKTIMRRILNPKDEPKAVFTLNKGENVKNIYTYCNIHGLWMC